LKRKQDPFWRKIAYMKNYIKPKYPHLHERAFRLMLTYAQKTIPGSTDYIGNK